MLRNTGHVHGDVPVFLAVNPDNRDFFRWALGVKGKTSYVAGMVVKREKGWVMLEPVPIPRRDVGCLRPQYELHGSTTKAILRRYGEGVADHLADRRVQWHVRESLKATWQGYVRGTVRHVLERGLRRKTAIRAAFETEDRVKIHTFMETLLDQVHHPASPEDLREALDQVDFITACSVLHDGMVEAVKNGVADRAAPAVSPVITIPEGFLSLRPYLVSLAGEMFPFELTDEQVDAIEEICQDIQQGRPMRRALIADVGAGKTAMFSVVVNAMIRSGHRVAVMLPNKVVAAQVHGHLVEWLPEVSINLIAGPKAAKAADPDAPLWVGTVGIQHTKGVVFDLVVSDEQHKFSPSQRSSKVAEGAHQLEVSATPIPRTIQMINMGLMQKTHVQRLHVNKRFTTTIWQEHERSQLFHEFRSRLSETHQGLVIYPALREDATGESDLLRLNQFKSMWVDMFGDRVGFLSSECSGEEADELRDRMVSGELLVLVATSAAEVGLDIPNLREAVLVQADRFGLSSLHQIRGRLARTGGEGRIHLYLRGTIKRVVMERLTAFQEISDGYRLAELDLSLRGAGDPTEYGIKQKGKPSKPPFIGRELNPMVAARACAALRREIEREMGIEPEAETRKAA